MANRAPSSLTATSFPDEQFFSVAFSDEQFFFDKSPEPPFASSALRLSTFFFGFFCQISGSPLRLGADNVPIVANSIVTIFVCSTAGGNPGFIITNSAALEGIQPYFIDVGAGSWW